MIPQGAIVVSGGSVFIGFRVAVEMVIGIIVGIPKMPLHTTIEAEKAELIREQKEEKFL